MTFTPDNYLLIGSLLLLGSIFAGKATHKIGAPLLLLFLGIGLLCGEKISFTDSAALSLLGELALVFILFSGGLDTKYADVRPVAVRGGVLATFGVFLTALFLGAFIFAVSKLDFVPLNFSFAESLLLGAIVSSTDAASVFSIFRSKNTGLKHNLRPLLELESGSNDPMAYVLTATLVSHVAASGQGEAPAAFWTAVPAVLMNLGVGALAGALFGLVFVRLINRINLIVEGLYPVMMVALTALTFSATKTCGGNGFLAVYVAGMILGNAPFVHKRLITKFYDGFAWLMQLSLFLTLGLFADVSAIKSVAAGGILISLFLIFVARPLAVGVCLAPFRPTARVFAFTSWVGLRGAVPIVFALIPLTTPGVDPETAKMIFNTVFFISVSSLVIQGTTLFAAAKRLGLTIEESAPAPSAFDKETEAIDAGYAEIAIAGTAPVVGKTLAELALPRGALVVMIRRENRFLTPTGATRLEAGDILRIQADTPEHLAAARERLEGSAEA